MKAFWPRCPRTNFKNQRATMYRATHFETTAKQHKSKMGQKTKETLLCK